MYGLAKKSFIDKEKRNPWKGLSKYRALQRWPILESFLQQQAISHMDFALAERLLRGVNNGDESVAAFLCHLSAAARAGHLCIKVVNGTVCPSPSLCWHIPKEEGDAATIEGDSLTKLINLIIEGAARLPDFLFENIEGVGAPLSRHGDAYYLHRYWAHETEFISYLTAFLSIEPDISIDSRVVNRDLEGKHLLSEQIRAILSVCGNNLTLVCGGPGTGKTYTAGHMIRSLWNCLPDPIKSTFTIALAAPTGKAAANLQNSLQNATGGLQGFPPLKAKTLHALLNLNEYVPTKASVISADFILIDESSMIDIGMMQRLLASIKPGARLVLLGDPNQLPPVEAGGAFADMVEYFKMSSGGDRHLIELERCMRAELKGIVDFAGAINGGDVDLVLRLLEKDDVQGVKRLVVDDIVEYVCNIYHGILHKGMDSEAILDSFSRFKLLSPIRRGPYGCDDLNRKILKKMMKGVGIGDSFVVPIMITGNDRQNGLCNGEVGVLIRKNSASMGPQKGDYALFYSKCGNQDEGGKWQVLTIPALLLPSFEYAFCMSIHKSQGCEFDHVVLLLPEGAQRFGREILYTAATRAKRFLEVYGEDDVIIDTVKKRSMRGSGIVTRMMNAATPEK